MKFNRFLSILLVLTMLISLFAALSLTASAKTYSTSSNSGVRGEICTELSAGAKGYYTGSYTYANLSKQSGATLRTSLKSLMSNGHDKSSYDDCKDYASKTDCQQNNGKVTLLYTGYQAKQNDYSASAPGWNREHVWPKNLGGFNTSGAAQICTIFVRTMLPQTATAAIESTERSAMVLPPRQRSSVRTTQSAAIITPPIMSRWMRSRAMSRESACMSTQDITAITPAPPVLRMFSKAWMLCLTGASWIRLILGKWAEMKLWRSVRETAMSSSTILNMHGCSSTRRFPRT